MITRQKSGGDDGRQWMQRAIEQIQDFLTLSTEVQEIVLHLGTEWDTPKLREELEEKRNKARDAESKLSQKFKLAKTHDYRTNPNEEHADRMIAQMQSIVDSFERVSAQWKQLYKESFKRQNSVKIEKNVNNETNNNNQHAKTPPKNNNTYFEKRRSSSFEAPPPALMQSLLGDELLPLSFTQVNEYKYEHREQIEQEIVLLRNETIQQLQKEMNNLIHFLKVTAGLIDKGGESLDIIEDSVQQTKEKTDDAVVNIAKSARQTPIVAWPRLTSATFLGIVGGVVAGPAGLALGGAAGAYIGDAVGQKLDQVAADIVDKQVMVNEMVKEGNWVPDETVSFCPLCKSEFNHFLRKHHCRVCGGVFCGYCSDKKLPILKKGFESPTLERACDTCFSKQWQE